MSVLVKAKVCGAGTHLNKCAARSRRGTLSSNSSAVLPFNCTLLTGWLFVYYSAAAQLTDYVAASFPNGRPSNRE